ncbi:MAG: FtsX-like permease family protein [Bryobacteraceae bacterium]
MFRYLPLMVKNALRNRRRSVLTICSVAASLCLLGVLMAIYHAFFFGEPTPEQALRLITRNRISLTNTMPISYRQKIQQVPGVREVLVMQWFGGTYKEPKNMFARFAIEPERFFTLYSEYLVPAEQKQAFIRERTACMLGKDVAAKYNLKIGDRITLVGDIFPVTMEFTVRAIYDYASDNETMYFHLDYLFESLSINRRDFAGTFAILGDSVGNVPVIAKAVDALFENAPVQTRTESEKAFQLGFISFLGNVKMFLLSICAAVTFTIVLVSANTMAMSVRERVREVGVLKTLGYTNGSILGIILGEAAVLSLIGGVIGCGLAYLLTYGVRQMPAFIAELKTLTIVPALAGLLLVTAVVIGLLSAFIPAWNASRTNILDSLRSSG